MNGRREHCFGLRKNSKRQNTYGESRAFHQSLSFGGESFKQWHDWQITILKQLTPQVRKTLTYPGSPKAQTNLLKYRIDLFVNETKRSGIENRNVVWLSGWGSLYKQNKLKESLKEHNFKFISSQIPNFELLSKKNNTSI